MKKILLFLGLLLVLTSSAAAQTPAVAYYSACPNSSSINPGSWGGTPPFDYNCFVDPNSMIAGNTLIVSIAFDNTGGGQTWSVVDDKGDTFTQIASSATTNSKQMLIFKATNIAGGETVIDMRLTGTLNGFWQPTVLEVYNAATTDVTSCNASGSASTSITAGSLTPTVTGDLIYQVSYFPNLSLGTPAQSAAYTAGSQANINWALWFELLEDGAAGQWGVYNSTSAINPTFTAASAQTFISCAVALKAGSVGAANSAAKRVNGAEFDAKPTLGSNIPWKMAANITGHTVYVTTMTNAIVNPTTCCAISSTPSLTWTQSGPDGGGTNGHNHSDVYCATSSAPIGPITMTLNFSAPGTNDGIFVIYDVDGWGCALDVDSGVQAGVDSTDLIPPLCISCLTPKSQNDFIVGNMGEAFNTVVGLNTQTNATFINDSCYNTFTNINGSSQTCENNGFFHGTNGSSTSAITLKLQNASGAQGGGPAQNWAGRLAAFTPLKTFTAATCNQTDVNAVINGPTHVAVDGDTIIIPAGSCTWASGVTVPGGIGISILGTGTPNSLPTQNGAGTVNTILTGAVFIFSPVMGNSTTRISTISFQPSGSTPPITVNGTCAAGGCPNLRMDNLIFPTAWQSQGLPDAAVTFISNVFGVADHNTVGDVAPTSSYVVLANVGHGAWQGVGGWGDKSYASADTFGTFQTFFFENNLMTYGVMTDTDIGNTNGGGARLACRFNNFVFLKGDIGACTGHGTDTTGRPRGVRQWEAYYNTGVCNNSTLGCSSAWPGRSGTGRSFSNSFSNVSGGFMTRLLVADAQRRWRTDTYGPCDGSGAFDTNDGTIYFSSAIGSVTSSGGGTTFILADSGTPAWTTNQWVSSGTPFSVHDATANGGAEIISNTSNTLTVLVPDQSHGTNFVAGQGYQILRSTVCMDQPDRGAGALLTGDINTPVLQSTGLPGPVNEALDPSYEAADTMPATASLYFDTNTASIIANRDFYTETVNQTAQTSPTSPFTGSTGTGHGTLANRPSSCTAGVGYWATDQGSWNSSSVGGQGQLYICTVTGTPGTWSLSYVPFTYPHPLISGVSTSPSVSLSPQSLSFIPQAIGTTSASQSITLTNGGTASLTITSIALTGGAASQFSIFSNTCGASLGIGVNCVVTLTYNPTLPGAQSANLTFTTNAPTSPDNATLSGSGVAIINLKGTGTISGSGSVHN